MTTDIKMLIAVGILSLLQFVPYFLAYLKSWGISGAVSNRNSMPELPEWANRALRAQRNLNENLVHFTIFVLAVHILGLSNEMSALGATIFFYSRLSYWVAYIAGITWVRSALFMVGVAGEVMIVMQLF